MAVSAKKKAVKKKAAKKKAAKKSLSAVGGYQILATTRDGVWILKPKGKPTSFTLKKLETAVTASSMGKKR